MRTKAKCFVREPNVSFPAPEVCWKPAAGRFLPRRFCLHWNNNQVQNLEIEWHCAHHNQITSAWTRTELPVAAPRLPIAQLMRSSPFTFCCLICFKNRNLSSISIPRILDASCYSSSISCLTLIFSFSGVSFVTGPARRSNCAP